MPVAVVSHAALRGKALSLGFPLYTKVKCESGLNGYQIWDEWIRANVFWVIETAFDPTAHVKITESAQLVGELKDPWELRCQKFLEGSDEYNTFNPLPGDVSTHVNRQAMQVAVSNAMFKYKVDFETEASGEVVTHNALTVAIFDSAEDSSISYTSDIEVAQLWTTRVLERYIGATMTPILEKRAYADDPALEESYPWIGVGELTPDEYELWKEHNIKPEVALDDVPLDIRAIDERTETQKDADAEAFDEHCHLLELNEKAGMAYDNPISAFRKETISLEPESFASSTEPRNMAEVLSRQIPESFAAISVPANISTEVKSGYERDYVCTPVSYSDSSSSSSSGGSSD